MEVPTHTTSVTAIEEVQWKKPDMGWIKINSDGATDENRRRWAAGFVARDHTGAFIATAGARYDHIVDPVLIELMAGRDAVGITRERCLHRVHSETDCKEI